MTVRTLFSIPYSKYTPPTSHGTLQNAHQASSTRAQQPILGFLRSLPTFQQLPHGCRITFGVGGGHVPTFWIMLIRYFSKLRYAKKLQAGIPSMRRRTFSFPSLRNKMSGKIFPKALPSLPPTPLNSPIKSISLHKIATRILQLPMIPKCYQL